MKLKNKISGEIKEFALFDGNELQGGATLESLTNEWEDYEEPKDYFIISSFGDIERYSLHSFSNFQTQELKQIGNYFLSREEAEKAIEKLKAWKRLKDKGFRFNRWTIPEEPKTPHIKLVIEAEMDVPDSPYDLGLLFGGKE